VSDNEGHLRGEVARGEQAASLFRNEVYKETFDILRSRYTAELLSSAASEEEKRERMYFAIRALQHVEQHIESVAKTGEMAQAQLNELYKRR
tara:strand:- start:263 stop:538 length:276 start_codon:yes stop_codon:yes gene_type:complete